MRRRGRARVRGLWQVTVTALEDVVHVRRVLGVGFRVVLRHLPQAFTGAVVEVLDGLPRVVAERLAESHRAVLQRLDDAVRHAKLTPLSLLLKSSACAATVSA